MDILTTFLLCKHSCSAQNRTHSKCLALVSCCVCFVSPNVTTVLHTTSPYTPTPHPPIFLFLHSALVLLHPFYLSILWTGTCCEGLAIRPPRSRLHRLINDFTLADFQPFPGPIFSSIRFWLGMPKGEKGSEGAGIEKGMKMPSINLLAIWGRGWDRRVDLLALVLSDDMAPRFSLLFDFSSLFFCNCTPSLCHLILLYKKKNVFFPLSFYFTCV